MYDREMFHVKPDGEKKHYMNKEGQEKLNSRVLDLLKRIALVGLVKKSFLSQNYIPICLHEKILTRFSTNLLA